MRDRSTIPDAGPFGPSPWDQTHKRLSAHRPDRLKRVRTGTGEENGRPTVAGSYVRP
ncbi:hypothetical protein GCM10018966_027830 [Streptomyces yanii]